MIHFSFYQDARGRTYFLPNETIAHYQKDKRPHTLPQGVRKHYTKDRRVIYFLYPYSYPHPIQRLQSVFSTITLNEFRYYLDRTRFNEIQLNLPIDVYKYLFTFLDKSTLACLFLTCRFFKGLIKKAELATLSTNAIRNGHFKLFLWSQKFNPPPVNICNIAAESNHLSVLINLHALGYKLHHDILFCALHNLEMVKWLDGHTYVEVPCIFEHAAMTGNEEMFEWAKTRYLRINGFSLAYNAAKSGKLSILQAVYEAGYLESSCPYRGAIEGDHLHILEWLKSIKHPPPRFIEREDYLREKPRLLAWFRQNWQLVSQ